MLLLKIYSKDKIKILGFRSVEFSLFNKRYVQMAISMSIQDSNLTDQLKETRLRSKPLGKSSGIQQVSVKTCLTQQIATVSVWHSSTACKDGL